MTGAARNLLVELQVEELPPKALSRLGEAFAHELLASLKAQGLAGEHAAVTAFATPRRLAALVTAVAAVAADREVLRKVMPVAVALDAQERPTPALRKALAKLGRETLADTWPNAGDGHDRLLVQSDGKADAIFLRSLERGVTLAAGLQAALDHTLAKLPIPKVMSYQLDASSGPQVQPGWTTVHFVRPAHGLVALHGADVVPVSALGLSSGRATRGHRFEAAADPVMLQGADHYEQQLLEQGAVIARFEHRRAEIARQLQHAAHEQGLQPIDDDALLDEVTALVERPQVLRCRFDAAFLAVPPECLVLTMKANQKYFPLLDRDGKLTNQFLVVSNIRPADPSAVVQGNERVVRPRLADAKFFFDQDRKRTLESRLAGLDKVVYHAKLGSMGERVARVRSLAHAIGAQLRGAALAAQADRAAQLAKADLLTDMVGEFPELQGIMGGYYARHDGENEAVAFAVEDHYKPRFAGDALPRNEVGLVVALADKLETLAGLFGIGQVPTGDRDPFALRRHALGVIRMLVERDLPLAAPELVALAGRACGTDAQALQALTAFIDERLVGYLRDLGYSAQEVDAVVAVRPPRWGELPQRLAAVRAFAALPESPSLAAANKRIANILRKSESAPAATADPARFVEPAERALADAVRAVQPGADAHVEAGRYTESLRELAALKTPVDAFFDGVMVNAEDPALRANRLALLASLHRAMNRVADLSRLAV
ncbi:MAG: glycine--tRNA ligase subunit beta [Burkholderiaceae bacterium]